MASHTADIYRASLMDLKRWAFTAKQSERAYTAGGYPMAGCVMVTDGKLFARAKPSRPDVEAETYSFHHNKNGENYLAFVIACGITIGFFGPQGGRRTDCYLLTFFAVLAQIKAFSDAAIAAFGGGIRHCFGDSIFPLSPHLRIGFKGGAVTRMMMRFNHRANQGARVGVEMSFRDITTIFPYVDTARCMQMGNMATAALTISAVVFHNAAICCSGSVTEEMFMGRLSEYGTEEFPLGETTPRRSLAKLFQVMRAETV
jgi:hypothetical protein